MDAQLSKTGWRWAVLGPPTGQGTLIALQADEGEGLDRGRGREMEAVVGRRQKSLVNK